MQYVFLLTNKSLPADIDVRIRRRVVQVPVRQASIRPVVPVTAENGKRASYNPITIKTQNIKPWGETPKPPKEVF